MNSNDKLAKIAMNKSLLKEFHNSENDRIVYLNNNDEFQIQIFNPYSYVIGVAFTFNSNNIDSSHLLVVKPGERIWLDRYLTNHNKLKFSTYNVNNSEEIKKAIENNGIVNIYFYKEKNNIQNLLYTYNDNTYNWNNNYKTYDFEYTTTCNDSNISSISSYCNYYDTTNINTTLSIDSPVLSASSATYSSANTISSAASTNNQNNSRGLLKNFNKSIETGRIEQGGYSNQNFTNYYGDFENWYFKKETIKLIPQSQKQISSEDLNKKYCHNCGKKIKSTFKYCPNCGAEQ